MPSSSSKIDPLAAPVGSSASPPRHGKKQQQSPTSVSKFTWLIRVTLLLIAVSSGVGIWISILHVNDAVRMPPPQQTEVVLQEFKKGGYQTIEQQRAKQLAKHRAGGNTDDAQLHYYPALQCQAFGGPSVEAAQEMVYWQDIPSDSHYVSPFHPASSHNKNNDRPKQYMTFEPDGGGWNNIRMAMETVVGLAIATGRILVLPPEQRMYLLGQDRGKVKTDFSFQDFFPFQELAHDNDGLTMITMHEFLETTWGQMVNKITGEVEYPPLNQTQWDGQDVKLLKEWLRNVTHTPLWAPQSCMAVFPASGDHKDAVQLKEMHQEIQMDGGFLKDEYIDNPVPVDGTTMERMRENLAQRKELCLYDEEMQNEFVVHFMCYHKMRVRMLVHFYAFLFFEDWRDDLWMKRFMRDHMRYIDELQCAAARIVEATRRRAMEKDPASEGQFDTFHIRRGDFQFKQTRIDADVIYNNVKDKLQEGATVYIATDERDKKFFGPLKEHYNVFFLDDFKKELEGVNKNYYGMIDQLVASRGRLFFGCWHSTFTGFIMRMRGYHSVKENLPGHEQGLLLNSFYYVPKPALERMHRFAPLNGAFFNREFPTSWRDLDVGIGHLPHVMEH